MFLQRELLVASSLPSAGRRLPGALYRFGVGFAHQFLSTFVIGVFLRQLAGVSAFLLAYGVDGSFPQARITHYPLFAIHALFALLLGFAVGGVRRDRWMNWVWILPAAVFLITAMAARPSFGLPAFQPKADQTFWTRFFGRGCLPDQVCPESVGVLMPLLTAIAYSMGACVARTDLTGSSGMRRGMQAVALGLGVLMLFPVAVFCTVFLVGWAYPTSQTTILSQSVPAEPSAAWAFLTALIEVGLPAIFGGYLIAASLRQRNAAF